MTMDEINQVENAIDGFYVGYAYVRSLKGTRAGQYVFNMTPENISGYAGSPAPENGERMYNAV